MIELLNKIFGRVKKDKQEIEKINSNEILFTTPTISNEFPQTTEKKAQSEFDIFIHEDDYRQNEFLNIKSLSLIQEEFVSIKDVWENYSEEKEEYTLFKKCHVRKKIGLPNLSVSFEKLKSFFKTSSIGQVIINGQNLKNGFALSTENTTYFGVIENDFVTEFYISEWNENTINEITEINKTFNLLFVNWYHCDLIKND